MGKISLKSGSVVYQGSEKYEIQKPLDLKQVLTINSTTKEYKVLDITSLKNSPPDPPTEGAVLQIDHINHINEGHWSEAKKRYEIIEPLLKEGRTKAEVIKRAEEYGMHNVTLYRWINIYESSGLLSSLVPGFESRGGKGGHRLDSATEAIVKQTIQDLYLSPQKHRPRSVYREVKRKCRQAGAPAPHETTVRNRINQLSKKEVVKRREGSKKSKNLYDVLEGSFPEGKYPLDVIQIDHTLVDVIILDETYRKAIGRPWLTLAIDVYSRTIFGIYLSLDTPGFFGVGQCLQNGILRKDRFLKSLDVTGEWNEWGVPRTIHADNAREFRGNDLQRFSEEYSITLAWRPVARPQYGAHIERLMGTVMEQIHTLPGTTFSNIKERGDYDSDSKAVMTLNELERWLVNYIVNIYHETPHSSLGMTPNQKYSIGILGDEQTLGTGLPEIIEDEEKLRMCLMPFEERAIKRDGVVIDKVRYYHDVLRRWVNETEGKRGKRKFIFRRDPRDISTIYFYDPELKNYFPIPYRMISLPPISVWDLRKAQAHLEGKGIKNYDEFKIFQAHEVLKKIEVEAAGKTKAVRRQTAAKEFRKKKMAESSKVSKKDGAQHDFGNKTKLKESLLDDLFKDIKPFATKTIE